MSLYHTNFIALKTIVRKEITRFTRIWVQTILPPVITMSLYFLIFGNLIGKQINHIEGFSYMQFITPGLIMMSIITNSYSNTVSSFFSNKYQKSLEELLVSPVSNFVILIGFITGGVARGLMVGIVVSLVSLLFTHLEIAHVLIMLVVAILTAVLFSTAGVINAIFAKKFDDVTIIPTFVLTPLSYLGGIFYSISLLPSIWQNLSKANPILYMVNAFRYGVLGVSDINLVFAFGMIILFTIGLFVCAWVLLNKGVGIRT